MKEEIGPKQNDRCQNKAFAPVKRVSAVVSPKLKALQREIQFMQEKFFERIDLLLILLDQALLKGLKLT